MRILAIAFLTFVLSACASSAPPSVVRVDVPVPVACITKTPERPAFAVDGLPIGSGIWDKMSALRADRLQRRAYEAELEAALNACK